MGQTRSCFPVKFNYLIKLLKIDYFFNGKIDILLELILSNYIIISILNVQFLTWEHLSNKKNLKEKNISNNKYISKRF